MFESVEVAILIDCPRVKLENWERQWIWTPGCA
jgi:hypothetical protein